MRGGKREGAGRRTKEPELPPVGGQAKRKPWRDAFLKWGLADASTALVERPGDSWIDVCVKAVYRSLLRDPQTRLLREAADRTERRVPLPLIGSSDEPITYNIISYIPRPDRSKKPETKRE